MSEELNEQTQADDGVIRITLPAAEKQVQNETSEELRVQPVEDVQQAQQPSEDAVQQHVEEPIQDEQDSVEEVRVLEEVLDEVLDTDQKEEETGDLKISDDPEELVQEAPSEPKAVLPENIQKLVEFIEETGGTLEDYVRLNQDIDSLNEMQLLKEYYSQTRPHLDNEEIDFLMSDTFSYDEELDDEREVKRKKLAFKEEVNNAKKHLSSMKEKYYNEIKAGSRLTPDQQKAVDFFNRYNKEQEQQKQTFESQQSRFVQKTDEVFNDEFKGFEYGVGDKRYRFNVKNPAEVKNSQLDINNFVRKFLDKDNTIADAKGYHKALFTAMNADAIANHFYEQGKADAMKDSIARSKNIDMAPRGQHEGVTKVGGMTVRTVTGESGSKLRVKFNK